MPEYREFRMAARKAVLFALFAVAACARSEPAELLADDNEAARAVEQVRTPEQDDNALALGEWRTSVQDDASILEFGPAGAPAIFSLRCDGRRGLYLQSNGAAPTGDLPMMLVTMGSETRRLAVVAVTNGALPMLRAALMPQDPLLAVFARNRDPIVIRIGDAPPLALPSGPQVANYVNNCTSGSLGAPVAAAPANEAEPAPAAAPGNGA
jgi:predicted small lipoprotein YifL